MFAARDPGDVDRFFRGLAEHAFFGHLGVADPPLVEYVSGLLVRFVRSDGLRPPPAADAGRERIGWMLAAVHGAPDRDAEDYRTIGDSSLFWTGLYPEALMRIGPFDVRAVGKRAYWIVSTLEPADAAQRDLFARLSQQFDVCVAGLAEVRRAWGE